MSITIWNQHEQCTNPIATLLAVTKQRSRQPPLRAFGRRLVTLRRNLPKEKQSRGWVSLALKKLGATLGGSTLAQYEKGAVWAPDPAVLWGLSKIYHYPHEELIALLRMNRADPSMVDDDLPATAAPSVQPANGDAIGTTSPHDQNRAVPSDTAALQAAVVQLRELAQEFRSATKTAVDTTAKARRQIAATRALLSRSSPRLRKRGQ